jgi:16S rRNA (adenine1518-N6/adenine1519-N6)-dimethyltransferase
LQNKFQNFLNLKIIKQDIKTINYSNLFNDNEKVRIKIIGNLPYYLSSKILFDILENQYCISQVVIMLQKELVNRIIAKPHSKEYGILTVAVSLLSKAEQICNVAPGNFFPKPKVFSSVIKLNIKERTIDREEFIWVMKIVKQVFNQRRKVLKNSIQNLVTVGLGYDLEKFIEFAQNRNFCKFDLRAEDICPSEYIILAKILKEYKNSLNLVRI